LRNKQHKVYPYLLRDVPITHPNHVWSTDITYIPMRRGFMYLVAVIDWYSRHVRLRWSPKAGPGTGGFKLAWIPTGKYWPKNQSCGAGVRNFSRLLNTIRPNQPNWNRRRRFPSHGTRTSVVSKPAATRRGLWARF
jgi:hypothetical protein